jgi:dephospho-CoA kinase
MLVIGLTGGIGTGKSQVSNFLEKLGATVISADLIGHEMVRPETEGWRDVVTAFGREILTPGGEVDRKKLGAIVFSDADSLKRLNAITHPRIYSIIEERLESLDDQGREVVVVEAALLFEAGWTPLVDEVWVVTAPEAQVIRRLQERNKLDEKSIRARFGAQMRQAERVKRADVIMDNGGTLEELEGRVRQLWDSRALAR